MIGIYDMLINQELQEVLLDNPPFFHYWEGEFRLGGMGKLQLELITKCCSSLPSSVPKVAIETGAGLSTIWLLSLGFEVHSFVASEEVVQRMRKFLESYPELMDNWHVDVGFSELTLPPFALGGAAPSVGLCLIDGGHGIQTVFVDFVYSNYCLSKGGIMLIDDIEIGSPKLLDAVLQEDSNFATYKKTKKLSAYQKVSDNRLLPDWGAQKDILQQIGSGISDIENKTVALSV